MTNPYDAHMEAIAHAASEIERLERAVTAAHRVAEEVAQAVVAATGSEPRNTSAADALALTGQMESTLADQISLCQVIGGKLNDFAQVF